MSALRARLAAEDGISVVVAVATMAILVLLGTAAVQQSVSALQHADRDTHVKRALQAADAGIDAAIHALNRLDLGGVLNVDPLDPTGGVPQTCLVSTGGPVAGVDLADLPGGLVPDGNGRRWCPPVSEQIGGGAQVRYRVSDLARVADGGCTGAGVLGLDRRIVAVGTSGGVERRVTAKLRAAVSLLSGAAVQSGSATSDLTMSGTARVLGTVHSNASITGTGLNVIAGSAIPGPGSPPGTVSGVVPAGSTAHACQRFVLPLVDQGAAPVDNDNGTWSTGCVDVTGLLPVGCKPPLLPPTGGVEWDPATRVLRVWGNGRVVLTGDTYSFCRIRLEGSAILQVAGAVPAARLFLDDPAGCTGAGGAPLPGAGQIEVDGQARIVNCHAPTKPETLQLYAVGNASVATTQTLAGAAGLSAALTSTLCGLSLSTVATPMVVYAPRSRVTIGGTTGLAGQVAGDVVSLEGDASVSPVNALVNLNALGANPVLPLYQPEQYVECTAVGFEDVPDNAPQDGC